MFGKSLLNTVAVSTVAALGLTQAANASLTIDFRFSGTTAANNVVHSKDINVGDLTPITFQVWGMVAGQAAGQDGLGNAIITARSTLNNANIAGSITASTLNSAWNSGTLPGSASNLTADGIGDWGNQNNTTAANVNAANGYLRYRTVKASPNPVDWADANSPAGSTFSAIPNGFEFLLGTLTFTPTTANALGNVTYLSGAPAGGTISPGGWSEDTADSTVAAPTGSKTAATGTYVTGQAANGITINVVPEPTSLGFLGLGALGMLRRRRA